MGGDDVPPKKELRFGSGELRTRRNVVHISKDQEQNTSESGNLKFC